MWEGAGVRDLVMGLAKSNSSHCDLPVCEVSAIFSKKYLSHGQHAVNDDDDTDDDNDNSDAGSTFLFHKQTRYM